MNPFKFVDFSASDAEEAATRAHLAALYVQREAERTKRAQATPRPRPAKKFKAAPAREHTWALLGRHVYRDRRLAPAAKDLLGILATWARGRREVTAYVEQLADEQGVSVRTIQRAAAELLEFGYLDDIRREREGRKNKANVYVLSDLGRPTGTPQRRPAEGYERRRRQRAASPTPAAANPSQRPAKRIPAALAGASSVALLPPPRNTDGVTETTGHESCYATTPLFSRPPEGVDSFPPPGGSKGSGAALVGPLAPAAITPAPSRAERLQASTAAAPPPHSSPGGERGPIGASRPHTAPAAPPPPPDRNPYPPGSYAAERWDFFFANKPATWPPIGAGTPAKGTGGD
jgi:hypothetical protein